MFGFVHVFNILMQSEREVGGWGPEIAIYRKFSVRVEWVWSFDEKPKKKPTCS